MARITIRNLTLTRARVADFNGAGIRAEGGDLTIEHVRFIDDQDGILAAPSRSPATPSRWMRPRWMRPSGRARFW